MIEEWKVRERAYVLWEKDDRPEGSDKFYWRLAQEQLEAQGQPSDTDTAQPRIKRMAKRPRSINHYRTGT